MASKLMVGQSTAVAALVLFLALGGSHAARSPINGADLLNRSVPGDKLILHTVTGTDVDVSSFPKVPSAHMADEATTALHATSASRLDGYGFAQVNASAGSGDAATLLNGFGGLTLQCTGPSGDAGTVQLTIVSDSPQSAAFGASVIQSAHSSFQEGVVSPAIGKVPVTTPFTFPVTGGAQVTFSYKRSVGSTTTAVSGTFTMVLNNGCAAFGNAELSSQST